MTVEELYSRSEQEGECLLYYGGSVLLGKKKVSASRFVYEKTYGPLKPKQKLRKTCNNKACINRAHLTVQPLEKQMYSAVTMLSRSEIEKLDKRWSIQGFGSRNEYLRYLILKDVNDA
jgi:hypothetical protein